MINESEHPFPNKELMLLQKIHKEESLSKEDFEVISELLHKYLNLRADVFHDV
jgi:hypothetical protein